MGRYFFLKRMWQRMTNGKFYHLGLGSKKYPLHFLIPHGAFQVENLPTLKHNDLLSWFEDCSEGKIEGIVWHCGDGCLIKVMTKTWRSDSLDRLYSFWHAVSIIPYSSYGLKQNWVDGKGRQHCIQWWCSAGHWLSGMCFGVTVIMRSPPGGSWGPLCSLRHSEPTFTQYFLY